MVITPKNHFKQNYFVDREGHIQNFEKAVNILGQKEFSILVYYGIAGIGKTSLRKEFPKHLKEYNLKHQQQEVIWASIDLHLDKHREKNTFFRLSQNPNHFYNCDKIFYYKVNSRINFLNLGGLVFKVNVGHYPIVETV